MADEKNFRSEIVKIDKELERIQLEIEELLKKQEELSSRKEYLEEKLNDRELIAQTKGKDWSRRDFQWSKKIEDLRDKVFHMKEFRSLQLECINATMSGVDCILIMPTGGGKSLTFQLPALISPGFTLVISPLVSLMEDQLMSLQEFNVDASLLNAGSSREHVNSVHSKMITKDSGLKILYVTPEKIAKSKRFMAKLEKAYTAGCLSRTVIDEVHCTSQWGHDFRPDYKILGILKRQFPNSPILGLTATATSRVIEDVKKILNLRSNCVLLKASFNRPNLYYEVRVKPSTPDAVIDEIASVIKTQFSGQSGIVYCFSKKDSGDVAAGLRNRQVSASCYHADLTAESRSKVHQAWTKGSLKVQRMERAMFDLCRPDVLQVIVATIAFGMGIDKANVRFVIHHTMSKSMENYYQESGRAGRDGKKAHCILYYSPTDSSRQSCMVFTEQTGLENLYKMLSYCQDVQSCRRSLIGQHFGEEWKDEECKGMCDNCQRIQKNTGIPARKNLTKEAQHVLKILQNAQEISERVTMIKLLEAWSGKGNKKLRMKDLPAPAITSIDCQRFLILLLLDGILREDFHFTPFSTISYLVPGLRANNILAGKISVSMVLSHDSTEQVSTATPEKSKKRERKKSNTSTIKSEREGKRPRVEIAESESDSDMEYPTSSKRKQLNYNSASSSTDKPVVVIE